MQEQETERQLEEAAKEAENLIEPLAGAKQELEGEEMTLERKIFICKR